MRPDYYKDIDLKPPEDSCAKVWRFMSFAKYVALLESQSVFFARADTLGDPFEGSQSRRTIEIRNRFKDSIPKTARSLIGGADIARRRTFISCWHLNEYESQGMWKLYVEGTEGVAIQSRFVTLERCLWDVPRYEISIGLVNYIDYEKDSFCDDWVSPFVCKRHSFRHENEVRAIIFPHDRPRTVPPSEDLKPGLPIKVDMNILIEAVYTSPYAPSWFHELVASTSSRYGLKAPIEVSALRVEPVY